MNAEIEPYRPHNEVDSWTGVMPDVIKLAQYVSETEFVPKQLRNRPAAVAAAILSGREMGIGPMRALAHVHMVDGRPSLSAEQKRAAALAAGHEIVYVESTTVRCTVKGRRKGSDEWSTVTWTMDDAKNAKLAGKDNWRNYPRRMLQARATGELVDLIFPDASAGLATTEELVDDSDNAPIQTNGQEPRKRTAKRQTAVEVPQVVSTEVTTTAPKYAVAAPPLPGEDGYDDPAGVNGPRDTTAEAQPTTETSLSPPEAGAAPAGITTPQRTKIVAMLNGLGVKDRDQRLHVTGILINRPIESADHLTFDEAHAVIDTLGTVLRQDNPRAALDALLAETAQAQVEGTFDAEIVEDA
jgi:hypothetical protein